MTTFGELKAYLDNDGDWTEVPSRSRGRLPGGYDYRYRKQLPDGRVLRTKVSRSLDKQIGNSLLGHIVLDQLETTLAEFREVAAGRTPSPSDDEPKGETVPAWLVSRLIFTVGIPETTVRLMDTKEARRAWEDFTQRTTAADTENAGEGT